MTSSNSDQFNLYYLLQVQIKQKSQQNVQHTIHLLIIIMESKWESEANNIVGARIGCKFVGSS